jgi:hypothetical protein
VRLVDDNKQRFYALILPTPLSLSSFFARQCVGRHLEVENNIHQAEREFEFWKSFGKLMQKPRSICTSPGLEKLLQTFPAQCRFAGNPQSGGYAMRPLKRDWGTK